MVTRSKKSYAMGMALEDTYNVFKAPTHYIRYVKSGMNVNVTDEELDICDGTPGSAYPYRKQAEVGGTMEIPAWPGGGLEQLLALIFGKVTSTQQATSTAYKHVFEQDFNAVKSASIVHWAPELTNKDVEVYTGGVLSSLEIGYDGPGPITLKPTWDCGGFDASQSAPTRTYTSSPIFVWGNFQAKIDGVLNTKVTKATLKIERELDKQFGATGDPVTALMPNIKTPTDWKVTGSLEFPYETKDFIMEYLSGSTSGTTIDTIIKDKTLQLTCTGQTIESTYKYLMDFKMPRVNMSKCDRDKDSDKTIMYDIDYAARKFEGVDAGLGTNCILTGEVVSKVTAVT